MLIKNTLFKRGPDGTNFSLFQTKIVNIYTLFQTKMAGNHIFCSRTYLSSLYRGVPPESRRTAKFQSQKLDWDDICFQCHNHLFSEPFIGSLSWDTCTKIHFASSVLYHGVVACHHQCKQNQQWDLNVIESTIREHNNIYLIIAVC